MRRWKTCIVCVAVIYAATARICCFAGLFDDVKNAVGGAVNTAANVATAPTKVVINAAQVATGNAPPTAVYQPYLDVAKASGATIQATTSAAVAPQQEIYKHVQEIAGEAGPGAAFLVDLGTYVNQYQTELAASTAYAAANGLQLQNPLQLLSTPLSAA